MTQTVAECLTAAVDSATLITDINTNGANSTRIMPDLTQAQINEVVQKNVDHLEIILAYDGSNDLPNVVGSSSSKKTTCSDAITTGKAYIAANS
tara:strand:- start:83 stop:364 length:282 start_codon:yes stop_codon:yes gene_type:complete